MTRRGGVRRSAMWPTIAAAGSALLMTGLAGAQPPAPKRNTGVPPEMSRLATLAGRWQVHFESRGGPDEPFTSLRTSSTITRLHNGAFLQERVSMPTPSGHPIELVGIWGFDRFRSVYRFAWLDDTYALFDVHEGNWEGDSLVVTNLRARTTLVMEDQEVFGRMIWSQVGANSFTVESLASLDGGETWFTQARGRYSRRK